jgi:anti-sigma-K factor RskA
MDIEHSAFKENIPTYALGRLDADATAALEAHLRTCDSCRSDLASYKRLNQDRLAALPHQPSPVGPQERANPDLTDRRHTLLAWSLGQIAFVLSVLVLLGLNLATFLQLRSLQQEQARLLNQVQTDKAVLDILASPGTVSIPILGQQSPAVLLINKEQNTATLIAWDLPSLPEDQTYQAWLVQPDGIRISAATFRPAQGSSYTAGMLSSPQSLNTFSSLAVTIEPTGGSTQPTGDRILKVDF